MKWITTACFPEGVVDGALFAEVLKATEFDSQAEVAATWVGRRRTTDVFSPSTVDRIARENVLESARITGPDFRVSFHGLAGRSAGVIDVEGLENGPWRQTLLEIPRLNAMYVGDADDVFWQSERKQNAYKVLGRSLDHVEILADGTIDISANPGRRVALPGMWLWAAASMWLGRGAFEYLDRERLCASLPHATETHGPNELLRLDLYSPLDSRPRIRDKQRLFQEVADFSEIERSVQERPNDPSHEIFSGRFDNNGVRKLVQYIDLTSNRPVARSKADLKRTLILDKTSRVVQAYDEPFEL